MAVFSKVKNKVKTDTYKNTNHKRHTLYVHMYTCHNNKGQLVANSQCVPNFPPEISLSRLKQNINETELRRCLCDGSLCQQSVKHNHQWLLRTKISTLVCFSNVQTHFEIKWTNQIVFDSY